MILLNSAIFYGSNFIVDEDGVSLLSFAINGSTTNGWNPFSGLGESGYYGDPGAVHAWGIIPQILQIFSNKLFGYNLIILTLSFFMVLSSFYMLKSIYGKYNLLVVYSLSFLTFLSPIRYELIFQRHWISLSFCSAILIIFFNKYSNLSNTKRILVLSGIFFTALVLGSSASLSHLIIFSLLFFFLKCFVENKSAATFINYIFVGIFSLLVCLVLDSWQIFSIIFEHIFVKYSRDPIYFQTYSGIFKFEIYNQFLFFINLLHSGLISEFNTLNLLKPFLNQDAWNSITPIFPFVIVVCIRNYQSLNDIEKTSLLTIIILIILQWIYLSFPIFGYLINHYIHIYPLEKFYQCIHILEIILLYFFIRSNDLNIGLFEYYFIRFFLFAYTLLSILWIILVIDSTIINNQLNKILNVLLENNLIKDSLKLFIKKSIILQYELLSGSKSTLQFFYLTAVCLNFLILKQSIKQHRLKLRLNKVYFSLLILTTNILMSESVYPLNNNLDIWQLNLKIDQKISDFPESRIAKISTPCTSSDPNQVINNFFPIEDCQYGKLLKKYRHIVGYRNPPSLLLNPTKSFTQKDVSDWILQLSQHQNLSLTNMREFSNDLIPKTSPIFDLTGTKYLYSDYPLVNHPPSLITRYEGNQLFIYENLNAFNAEFLTRNIIYANDLDKLPNLSRHQIILDPSVTKSVGAFRAQEVIPTQSIRKISTKNIKPNLSYEVNTPSRQIFVVLDAWHPLWTVKVDGKQEEILKVNGVFKGVILEAGTHSVKFEFNDNFYKFGLLISFIAFSAFIYLVYLSFFCRKSKMQS
jgi:hypothetical protein